MKALVSWTYHVKHTDLEKEINDIYGMEFDFRRATGFAHPDCPEYIVTGLLIASDSVRAQIKRIRAGKWYSNVGFLLNLLCAEGHLRKGKYVIKVQPEMDRKQIYLDLIASHGVHSEICSDYRLKHTELKGWFEMIRKKLEMLHV